MKFSIKPVALAVTVVLASAAVHAQTLPTMGTGNAADGGSNDGLFLAVWDNTSLHTDLVSLSTLYSDIAITNGTSILTTPTVGSNGWSAVSNFQGQNVDQLDVGTLSNFASVFGTPSSTTFYAVVGANNTSTGASYTAPANTTYQGGDLANMHGSVSGESAAWALASSSGPLADTTGTAAFNVVTGACSATLCDGTENNGGINLGVNVGSAAAFYDSTRASSRVPVTTATYTYNGQDGFWFLSDTGELTWNLIAATTSTVPLPPAVWLFASGLIGLGVIGRRRQSNLGAAV